MRWEPSPAARDAGRHRHHRGTWGRGHGCGHVCADTALCLCKCSVCPACYDTGTPASGQQLGPSWLRGSAARRGGRGDGPLLPSAARAAAPPGPAASLAGAAASPQAGGAPCIPLNPFPATGRAGEQRPRSRRGANSTSTLTPVQLPLPSAPPALSPSTAQQSSCSQSTLACL